MEKIFSYVVLLAFLLGHHSSMNAQQISFRVEGKTTQSNFIVSKEKSTLIDNKKHINEYRVFEKEANISDLFLLDDLGKVNLQVSLEFENTKINFSPYNPLDEGFAIIFSSGTKEKFNLKKAAFYKGQVNNERNSFAVMSIWQGEVSIFYSTQNGNYSFTKLRDSEKYIFYNDENILAKRAKSICISSEETLQPSEKNKSRSENHKDRTRFKFYLEVDNEMYRSHYKSKARTLNYVFNLFLQESVLFAIEGVDIQLGSVYIWDDQSPYANTSGTSDLLERFRSSNEHRQFDYDVMHLLTSRSLGGGRGYIDGICRKIPFAVSSGLNAQVVPFPTYSWDLLVFSHENGHLFGLRHTHGCYWGPNKDRVIDDCGNYFITNNLLDDNNDGIVDNLEEAEGGICFDPENPILPVSGGTLMSYCHLLNGSSDNEPNIGINLSLGFGQELKYRLAELRNCGCDHPDYDKMIALYHSTEGHFWKENQGWRQASLGKNCDPCSWFGVRCNSSGRVVEISLAQNRLDGPLIHDLAELEFLTNLDLSDNELEGCIPNNFNRICRTANINLSGNLNLSHDSNYNNFCQNISQDCACPTSEIIALQQIYNLLDGNDWNNNQGWSEVNCNPCSWFGISCNDTGEITEIDLSNNNLRGEFPEEFLNITSLKVLNLFGNSLQGDVPESLNKFYGLHTLNLGSNDLSGCIPYSLKNMCGIVNLNLQENDSLDMDFISFCESEGSTCTCDHPDVSALLDLYRKTDGENWDDNSGWKEGITGLSCDPCSWKGVKCNSERRVSRLTLTDNNLVGVIPESIGELSELEVLIFDGTPAWGFNIELSGELPESISRLTKLTTLKIRGFHSKIRGSIPESYGMLTELKTLLLSGPCCEAEGGLEGNIPESFVNLKNLEQLSLYSHGLTGEIPEFLDELQELRTLNLSRNKFSGTIPKNLGNLKNLVNLILAINELNGPIPEELNKLTRIRQLNLRTNYFTTFPDLSALKDMYILTLADNQIRQKLPDWLGNMTALVNIQVDGNDFFGCIPDSYYNFCGQLNSASDFSRNPKLPWGGKLSTFCSRGDQIGALCSDGFSNTLFDAIDEDCKCTGLLFCSQDHVSEISHTLCGQDSLYGYTMEGVYIDTLVSEDGCDSIRLLNLYKTTDKDLNVISIITLPSCYGYQDASIDVMNENTDSLTFHWSTGKLETGFSSSISNLNSGKYWLVTTNKECISDTFFYNVPVPEGIKVDQFHIEQPDCFNNAYGSFDSSLNDDDKMKYSFEWGHTSSNDVSLDLLNSGTYFMTITSNENCAVEESFVIHNYNRFALIIDSSNAHFELCDGETTSFDLSAHSPFITNYFINEQEVDSEIVLGPGYYNILAEEETGCQDSATIFIENISPEFEFEIIIDSSDCANLKHQFLLNLIQEQEDLVLFLNDSPVTLSDTIDIPIGDNHIELESSIGCTWDTTINLSPEYIKIDLVDEVLLQESELIEITSVISSYSELKYVDWSSSNIECLNTSCSEFLLSGVSSEIIVGQFVFNNGCVFTDSLISIVVPTVFDKNDIFVPNALYRESGENSKLCVFLDNQIATVSSFSLYDRWGGVFFQTSLDRNDVENCLDYSNSILMDANSGVYIYILVVELKDGRTERFYGDITVF